MNKIRFQQWIIALLVVTNILLLLFGFVLRKPHPDHDRPKRLVIERLKLDDAQVKEYEKFIFWHRKNIREKNNEMLSLKGKLYSLLKSPIVNEQEDSLTIEIGQVQQEIEAIHYTHFLQIKSICREDQLPEFNKLADEITSVFMMKHPR